MPEFATAEDASLYSLDRKAYYQHKRKQTRSVLASFFVISLVVLIATGFFVANIQSAHAQEDTTSESVANTNSNDATDIDPTLLEDTPDAVIEDTVITSQDLQIEEPTLLPDSPFYGFKNVFRGFRKGLTFDPAKKAELEIRFASERVVEAEKLLQKHDGQGASEEDKAKAQAKVEEALGAYQQDLTSAIERINEIKSDVDSTGDPNDAQKLNVVLDNLTDKVLKQEKLIGNLEEKLEQQNGSGRRILKVIEHKEDALEKLGTVLTHVEEDPEKVADRITRIVDGQRGSDFKHLKAMEVLHTVEDKLENENAKEAIAASRERMRMRFEENLEALPEDERFDKFDKYMRHAPGNAIHHLQIVDELKASGELPEDVKARMELMKEKMAQKFESRFEAQEDEALRKHFLRPLEEGDAFDNLRLAADLKERVPEEIKQQIADHEQASVQKFREHFQGDGQAQILADKAEKLMAQIRENPDPSTFRALQELENQLTPEQKKFVRSLEAEGAKEISRRFEEHGDDFFEQIATGNPEDLELFEELGREGFTPGENPFARAGALQAEFVTEHIGHIDDPRVFERLQGEFEDRPDLRRRFNEHQGFDQAFNQQDAKLEDVQAMMHKEFEARLEHAKAQAEAAGVEFNEADAERAKEFLEHNKRAVEEDFKRRIERGEVPLEGDHRPRPPFEERPDFDPSQFPPHKDDEPDAAGLNVQDHRRLPPEFKDNAGNKPFDKPFEDHRGDGSAQGFPGEPFNGEPKDNFRPNEHFEERPDFRPGESPTGFRPDERPDERPDFRQEHKDDFQKRDFQNHQPNDFQRPPGDFNKPGIPQQNAPGGHQQPPSGFKPDAAGNFPPQHQPPPQGQPDGTVLGAQDQQLPDPIPDVHSKTFPIDMVTGFIKLITFTY